MIGPIRELWPRSASGLPPGQGLVSTFPRFGVHFASPLPEVPPEPSIAVSGAVSAPFELPLSALHERPRRTLVADFHCVAGWSVRDLRWEGVAFRALWEESILPHAQPRITHLEFVGLDGYGSVLTIEDALADDVLIADRLDGAPLTGDHGAPARVVSPQQYGYMNTKHLSRLVLHTREPSVRGTHRASARSCSRSSRRTRARGWRTRSATGISPPGRSGSPTNGSSCRSSRPAWGQTHDLRDRSTIT